MDAAVVFRSVTGQRHAGEPSLAMVVALNKCDSVSPSEAEAQARAVIASAHSHGVDVVSLCQLSCATLSGLEPLLDAIQALVKAKCVQRGASVCVLWDR